MSANLLQGKVLTGYHREDTFIATRKYMGGRPVFHLDMCIAQLTAGVDAPPVGVAQEDNRIVKENRGRLFRDYVNSNKEWASPSLLLWCPIGILDFDALPQINDLVRDPSVVLGVLSVPRNSRQSIKILDGQHRILGFHLWMDQLNKELQTSKLNLSEAMKAGQPKVIELAKVRVEKAEENMERSVKESIGIDILICSSAREARQIFADIANNAQGMVKALAIGFDQSKLVNRVTSIVASDFPHPLLDGKVDFNKDRIAGDSEMLISAKTLADSIRALTVGITGRISRVQELGDLDEDVTQRTKKYLDCMQKAFADDFAKTPQDFRKTSLLSSGTMFRVLAGVWFELTSSTNAQGKSIKPRMSVEDATNFFKKLAPQMQIPIKPGNKWLTTGVFPSPAAGAVVTAPGSRNQELKKLTLEITNWALDSKSFPLISLRIGEKMPNIYDNSTGKVLSDAIETALTNAESLDACIGYFNLRGWRTLDRTIDDLRPKNREKARILIGMLDRPDQTVLQSLRLSAVRGNKLIYDGEVMANELDSVLENFAGQLVSGIPNANDKKALVRLSNHLRSGEVVIKAYLAQRLHAKLYLANRGNDAVTPRVAFVGSSNLTLAGLEGQGELNIDVHDQDATNKLSLWFDDKWDDINAFDISATLADLIDSSWINQADPFLVYLKFAYFLSHEAREGNSIVEIPRDIEPLLLDFQKSAVKTATRILQRNNGVMIADVVGLGKTLTATAIARVMEEAENVETLIICPKNLEDMWQEYVRAYKLRGARVMPISMARTELGDLGRYRLVIIDESHNLRNAGGQTYNAVREYIAKNEPRVVLLTATPYNINLTDIADQLSLFIGDEQLLQVKPDLAIQAAGGYFNFSKLTRGAAPNSMKAFRKSEYVEDWRSLLQYYMVRRTREFVKKNYASTDSKGKKYLIFPNNPGKKLYFPDRIPHFLEMKDADKEEREVIDAATLAGNLKLARQGLGNYLLPSAANLDDELIRDIKGQKQTLQGLTRTNLVKRRSSSPAAFSLTLQRHLIRDFAFLHAIDSNCPLPIGAGSLLDGEPTFLKAEEMIDVQENQSVNNVTLLSIAADGSVGHISLSEAATIGKMAYEKIALRKPDQIRWADLVHFDVKRLRDDLSSDIDSMFKALETIGVISPSEDSKLDLLFNEVIKKNDGKKVLIFSEYQDTVDYVANSLRTRFKLTNIESVNSGTTDIQKVVRRFSPKSNANIGGLPTGEVEIQYLVSTDVLSEGQNLQDASIIANFDLPWALIKLVQRAGRVDRLGQESDRVDVYVIDPSPEANRQIGLRQRLQARLIEAGAVIGGDDRFFGSDLEAQAISDILTGNSNLEADDPQDVDPASYAYEIWRKGIEEFPQVKNLVINLPLSSRSTIKSKNELLNGRVYALTVVSGQHNISSYVTMDGSYHSISPIEILLKTKCEFGGLPEEELAGHLDALQIIADGSIESVGQGTVAMAGARKALYEAVKDHARLVEGSLFTDNEARMALQAIYNLPMTEVAKAVFSQGIRNADPSELIDKMVTLYNEGALVIEESGNESGSLQFIGSIGMNGAKK